jgi:methionyl-tRNA formyltransferase
MNAYGPIEGIVLLGGGTLLRRLCLWATSQGVPIKVVTSPRHATEVVDGESLSEFLFCHKIENVTIEDLSGEAIKRFLSDTKDYFYLSLGAAWIFKESIIHSLFRNRLLNLHGTRLPQNRGGGGFSWQILMGNRFGFCVLHRIDGGVDTGEIVAFDEFLYPSTARKPIDFETVYIERNLHFVIGFIEKHRSQNLPLHSVHQSEYFSTYWPRLSTDINGWINWSLDPAEIERFVCAFDDPYAGAQTLLNGNKVRLKSVCLSPQDGVFHSYQSGIIYRKGKSWICVALRGSTLVVEGLYDEQGRDILHSVRVGDRFNTPLSLLDTSINRPIYGAKGLKLS